MWFFGGGNNVEEHPEVPEAQISKDETLSVDESKELSQTAPAAEDPDQNVSSILNSADFDPSRLHPLAGLDKDIEYLDLDEEKLSTMEGTGNGILPSRGWQDDLCYGTGACYLSGLVVGGTKGLSEGIAHMPQPKLDPVTGELRSVPMKLKLNTVLNQVTKFGPHVGNNSGVLALMYNIFDAVLDNKRGLHDDWNSLAAGFLTGALFKCTAGPRAMAVGAGLMTGAAGTWCGFKRLLMRQEAQRQKQFA